jgi:hypothetical protein
MEKAMIIYEMQHNKHMQADLVPLMRGVQFAITSNISALIKA